MRRMLLVGALVTGAGCNQVLGLEPVSSRDGQADDATAPHDGGDDAPAPLGRWGTPVPITNLATLIDEEDPAMNPAGNELYFTSLDTENATGLDVLVSRRTGSGGAWGPPERVATLSSPSNDGSVRLGADGLTLYLASDRNGTTGGFDVWRSFRFSTGDPWSAPTRFDAPGLNTTSSDRSASPCLGGTRFVFQSDRAGTPDLYELADSAPAPIPGASDPVITEGAPFVTEDCLTLYFASSQTGGLDLYVMTRPTLDGAWSNPQAITDLNSGGLEADPWVSPDQRTIVFSYDPTGAGAYDLYMATR
ncbi:MAG: PD40 domain-containing protein [Myxococcales bacterium]|nr:PD40 domain-containing protein [Myxococcales bacterium]